MESGIRPGIFGNGLHLMANKVDRISLMIACYAEAWEG